MERRGLLLLWAVPLFCQQKDFLTEDEVERVRLAQDPVERLKLYVLLGRQRVDQLEQLFAKEKAGRSVLIHDLLEQYAKIIEAIDIVADDALRRGLAIEEGIVAAVAAEKLMLGKLEKFQALEARDLSRYEFVLQSAVDATRDSIEASEEDLSSRAKRVTEEAKKEKKDREALLTPEERDEKVAGEKKLNEDPKLKGRKPPTLRRKGEEAGEGADPAKTPAKTPARTPVKKTP
jgi:hypothetical protein